MLHGVLGASAETIEGPKPSDCFDVFVDERGDLVVLLMDVQHTVEASDGFVASLTRECRKALSDAEPFHSIVNALEMQLAARPSVEAGVVMLRISQRTAKVEVLNAGMPAIASAGPGEQVELHEALSGPVGRRVGEVHPYEILPLVWGSTWLAVSDGMTNGSLDPVHVVALCAKLDLSARGLALTTASSDEQYDSFQGLLSAARFLRDDATFVLMSTGPAARLQSGAAGER